MHTGSAQPIGIFDSGVGGLSVAAQIRQLLPLESICYVADTANVPYGERSDDEIRTLTSQAVAWLYEQNCKAVVIACNTASAFSLTPLRAHYGEQLPIIGLVPAVKPAVHSALHAQRSQIGVLATQGTMRGTLLQEVIHQVATPNQINVILAISPALVPFVEAGLQHSADCYAELERILTPMAQQGVRELVLGCTHYPFLAQSIQHVFPDVFTLLDSGAAVARQTQRILSQMQRLNTQTTQPATHCYVTGAVAPTQSIIQQLAPWVDTVSSLSRPHTVQQVVTSTSA